LKFFFWHLEDLANSCQRLFMVGFFPSAGRHLHFRLAVWPQTC